ncbi:MAG: MoxR family ATPase [Gammaproteobacteria bacterium]|nr:MoxR family ATPase [Gammaproteobacteria bacterium]
MAERLSALTIDSRHGQARALAEQAIREVGQVILGKQNEIRLAVTCLLAQGHLLIEDVPGVGKTLLARSLAAVLGLSFRRIQFTSDLLPADITGASVFDRSSGRFLFQPGPLFAQVILADEVNRATPKAQSALLEAMEEQQVSIDGVSHALPAPFFVIATQNPAQQIGTFPLPESQLDRFLLRIGLGYPAEPLERKLLRGEDRRQLLAGLRPVMGLEELAALREATRAVQVTDAVLDYVQALVRYTREAPQFELGLSPRAAVDLVAAARCWAMIAGHGGVYPEDVQAVFPAVAGHRLRRRGDADFSSGNPAEAVLGEVAIP